jgi:hypothetical protein
MKPLKIDPPNQSDWGKLPIDIKFYIAMRLFFAIDAPRLSDNILRFLYRVDLWLFPPLAFYSVYLLTTRDFPEHPIKMVAVLATSFMAATLTLFLIRPPKRRPYHVLK